MNERDRQTLDGYVRPELGGIQDALRELTGEVAHIPQATAGAISAHQEYCGDHNLAPIRGDLAWLVRNAQDRSAIAEERRRVTRRVTKIAGAAGAVIAVATPFIVHWL